MAAATEGAAVDNFSEEIFDELTSPDADFGDETPPVDGVGGGAKPSPRKDQDGNDDQTDDDNQSQDDDDNDQASRSPVNKGGIPEELIDLAESVGMDREEAEGFKSAGDLRRAIRLLNRQTVNRQQSQPAGRDDSRTGGRDDQGGAAGKRGADEDDFKLELDEDLIDEPVVAAFKKTRELIAPRIRTLEAKIDNLLANVRAQQVQEAERKLNELFGELDDDMRGYFGEGDTASLDPKGEFRKRRDGIVDQMNIIAMGYQSTGRPIPNLKVLHRQAIRLLVDEEDVAEAAKTASRKSGKQQARRDTASQFIARPTSRTGNAPGRKTGDDEGRAISGSAAEKSAVAAVERKLRQYT